MYIIKQSVGDPILLDTESGLRALHERMTVFLSSAEGEATFAAATSESRAQYEDFLRGLRVWKRDGKASFQLASDGWLELSGSVEELEVFKERLVVTEDQGHRHFYCAPVSLIIEADNYYPDV